MVIGASRTFDVLGMANFMRIRPEHGSIEIGSIVILMA